MHSAPKRCAPGKSSNAKSLKKPTAWVQVWYCCECGQAEMIKINSHCTNYPCPHRRCTNCQSEWIEERVTLNTGKVVNRHTPISKTIETPYGFGQEPHSLKGEESLPVESPAVGIHMNLQPENILIYQDGLPIGIGKDSNFGIKSLSTQKSEGKTTFDDDGNNIDIKSDIIGNSNTLSVTTKADSIFSSSAVLSGSSISSLHGSEDTANRLVELLLEDQTIHSLCCRALLSIDRDRFERNLRRLLKRFASELRKEAKSKGQRSASHFVALRARNSAHMICSKLNKTRSRISATKELDDDGSDDTESKSSDDGLDSIQQLEIFIKTSQAIQVLRENLGSFVEQFDEGNRKGSNEEVSNVAVEEPKCPEAEERGRKDEEVETYWVQLVRDFYNAAVRIICQRPVLVETGKTQIQWQCKCGHKIFDNFIELQLGAADRYKRTFDRSNNTGTSSRSSNFSSLIRTLSSWLGSVKGVLSFGAKKLEEGGLPLHERYSPTPEAGQGTSCEQVPKVPPPDLLFLLLCYSQGRYATKLLQLDLVTLQVTSDKALFKLLRCNYASMRCRLSSWFSLRTLVGIKFVQFELYRSLLVDVRKTDDVPPPTEKNYRYRPAPPEIIPPVGERHLLHLFENPECAEDDEQCLLRFPKKLKEKLKCNSGVSPGWGLQFIEGWDIKKIWIIVFVFFGFGSLLIGVLWACFQHSIQDAFAIAGYIVAFATVSVGTIQALLVI